MKFIHTGDWHLGKIVNQVSMLEDQRYVLEQFVALVAAERPDAVILSGDLYDRSIPPAEAVELMDKTLTALAGELKTPVLAVAGNHDSPDRIDFGRRLFCDQQLYIEGRIHLPLTPVTIRDEYGPVQCYLLPYAHPSEVRTLLGDETIKTQEDAFRALTAALSPASNSERRILITHGYFQGGNQLETSESERPLNIGGSDIVSAKLLDGFQYVALGHLHGPQQVTNKSYYAGSLLKYSFSEARQKKSVAIVEMGADGSVTLRRETLTPQRDMRCIKGALSALLDPAVYAETNTDDYLAVTLTDEGEILDPIGQLRSVYPHVMVVEREQRPLNPLYSSVSLGEVRTLPADKLFKSFYEEMTGNTFTTERAAVLTETMENIARREREA